MSDLRLDPRTTALVLIDLQKGIMARETVPHTTGEVLANATRLAAAFRAAGAYIVLVRVTMAPGEWLRPITDQPAPTMGNMPDDWAEIVPELGPQESAHVLTKRNWGAFHGTEMDTVLRRRGIETIVLGGIATEFGVDTTAREAFQHGYQQVFATDAYAGLTRQGHEYVEQVIFPRMGRLRTTDQIVAALY